MLIFLAALAFVLIAALAVTDPRVTGPVDMQLRLQAAVTKTATFNSDALDMGAGFAPASGGVPVQAIVPVTALDDGDGSETYSFKLQDSPDNSTWTNITPDVAATETGTLLVKGFQTQRYVRLVATLGGITPSITYGDAFLVPHRL